SDGRTASSTCCQKGARSASRSETQASDASWGRSRNHDVSSTVFPAPGGPETRVSAQSEAPVSRRSKSRGRRTTEGGDFGRWSSAPALSGSTRRGGRALGAVFATHTTGCSGSRYRRTAGADRWVRRTRGRNVLHFAADLRHCPTLSARQNAYEWSSRRGEASSPTAVPAWGRNVGRRRLRAPYQRPSQRFPACELRRP